MGTLVYRDWTSKLARDMLVILMLASFWSRCPELMMWAGLIVPSRGVRILVIALAILWGALPIPDVIGRMGMLSLCVFGRPYRVGIRGWYSIREAHDLSSCCMIFLYVVLNLCISA